MFQNVRLTYMQTKLFTFFLFFFLPLFNLKGSSYYQAFLKLEVTELLKYLPANEVSVTDNLMIKDILWVKLGITGQSKGFSKPRIICIVLHILCIFTEIYYMRIS